MANFLDNDFSPQTALQGVAQGATLGFNKKIESAIAATYLKAAKSDPRSFKELYSMGLKAKPQIESAISARNPVQSLGGQLAGGSALPWKATTIPGGIATGAGYGALAGVGGNTEGEALQPSAEDFISGLYGAPIGAALGGVGQGLINRFTGKVQVNPEFQKNIQQFEQHNVPYNRSDITGDPLHLLAEENAALGNFGPTTKGNALQFKEAQREAFGNAQNKLQNETLGNGQPFIEKGAQAQDVVKGLQEKALSERAPINEAYNQAKQEIGRLDIKEVNKFPELATHILQSPEVSLSSANAPKAYQQLKAFDQLFSKSEDVKALDFRGLESWRQGLNKAITGIEKGGQDEVGVNVLKDTFDDWIGNNIEKALVEGDSKVLSKFKDARKLSSEWMNKYYGNNPKDVGKNFVRKMVEDARQGNEPLTPEVIVNKIFGASELGFSNDSAAIVKELKKHIPDKAVDQLRSEAGAKLLKPLLKPTPNVTTYNNNLDKLLSEKHSLVKELLKPEQIKELKEFGELGRKIYGAKNNSRINPSGTNIREKLEKIANKKYGWLAEIFKKSPVEFNQAALKKELLTGEKIQKPLSRGLRGIVPMGSSNE